ncbi:hypothetical protein IRP63_04685 [Clostridium botulinum]|uniref:Uncharacterized protein n=1 Tax=Clostridium botulinum C/D str. DC5 TaxID=1443128 RepID=A0A0A0IIZ4_CLOBO|nr:hypothetical protein [Clostridium botulinum]KGM95026.1 hypothetical protein Z956_05935 [Clostridium botulinum D str. CCUG 7971]KGN00197.1 hypothetical protein Z955_04165 [Clostridium botulinum C/D str. DC5]KOC50838.1 hypothetical protein ADU88_01215 [Clostridium botulinum]KOC51712.1 hypothetical protein ADU89_12980 [Clostridium botulinum]KOC54792.1 hypothetical protein ADU90_12255 [Clostridium botulinum]
MIINENQLISNHIYQYLNAPAKSITITNNGGYVAFFTVDFYINSKLYTHKSPNLTYGKSFKIIYGLNARQIRITAYCYTATGDTKLICKKASYTPVTLCFSLKGTVLNPTCTEVSCPPDNSIPPELPPQNPCCYCYCCCCSKMFN